MQAILAKQDYGTMNQAHQITVDEQGRLVIPARLRRRLKLSPGMALVVEKGQKGEICLRVPGKKPFLTEIGGVLVVQAEPVDDLTDLVYHKLEDR